MLVDKYPVGHHNSKKPAFLSLATKSGTVLSENPVFVQTCLNDLASEIPEQH